MSIPSRSGFHHRLVTMFLGVAAGLAIAAGVALGDDRSLSASEPSVEPDIGDDYDPWSTFNERMFSFNHDVVDRFVVKRAATAWDKVCPDPVKRGVGRAISNLKVPRRLINNLLQGRLLGAGAEASRFVINTTVGVGGFLDVAERLHIEASEADMGETLGVWGLGQGPYLVLPFLSPLTVRDGVGSAVDAVLDPLWLVPFFGGTVMGLVNTVNERSLHLRLFADVEESSLDLYSSVRNGYLQRRRLVLAKRHRTFVRAGRTLMGLPAPAPVVTRPADADGSGA
jgi:phospholipid-binding lipoprotein MlaA